MSALYAEHDDTRIALYRSGLSAPLVTQTAALGHRPYIHPLLAPDGVGELTENQPGHHLWQHGLYVGLNDVNGVGFWTEGYAGHAATDGTFHPHPLAPPTVEGDRAQWRVTTEWRSPTGEPLLTEKQAWTFHDRGASLALELEWELCAATDLRFGAYPYGGLFLRMPWRAETGANLLTSEGADSLADAEGKRARWVAVAMPIPGRDSGKAGVANVALLDHPGNPEHPSPWRTDDNYGIVPSRCIAGAWRLTRGESTVSRYRLRAALGGISRPSVESEWQAFAGVSDNL